jgi:glycosyltransferase involved in cell wall biosynthesis
VHILFLTDNFPPETNAPASRTFEHASAWVRAGHTVTVVTCAPNFPRGEVHAGYRNRWRSREVVDGIEVVRVWTYIAENKGFARRALDHVSFGVNGALAGLFARRPDVVVATSPQFFTAVGGWTVGALRRIPFVFELRDLWPASIAAVGALEPGVVLGSLERLERFLYRRATAVIAVSDAFRRDLVARGVEAEKVHVVTNGVDLSSYAPRPRDEDRAAALGLAGRFVVGYLGTHGMAHALENVLDAADLLRGDDRIRFLFVGDGAAKADLIREAQRRALRNVVFAPPVAKDAMPALWSVCDAALVHLKDAPVFETVIPSKIFEAFGMGVPVLFAGRAGEGSEIVRRAAAGTCVAAEDPVALAIAVRALASNPDQCARYAANAHGAAPQYDREVLARRLLDILLDVADGRTTRVAAQREGASRAG